MYKYKRRFGTSGIDGQLYEEQLLTNLLAEGIRQKDEGKIDKFYLATNMDEAGSMDDVVLKVLYKCPGTSSEISLRTDIIFLQAKHKEHPERDKINMEQLMSVAEKGDFSLKKYFASYRKIKQLYSSDLSSANREHPIFADKFTNCSFIIYTNAPLDMGKYANIFITERINRDSVLFTNENSKMEYYKVAFLPQWESDEVIQSAKNKIIDVLISSSDCARLAEQLAAAIFTPREIDVDRGIFKVYHAALARSVIAKLPSGEGRLSNEFLFNENFFKTTFLNEAKKYIANPQISVEDLLLELANRSITLPDHFGNIKSKNENASLPDDCITEDDILEFFDKLLLFTGQPDVNQLASIVKEKIQKYYSVEDNEIDARYSEIKLKVENWWRKGDTFLTEVNSFIQDSVRVSIQFNVKEPVCQFTGREEELKELHEKLKRSKMVVISGLGGVGKTELARRYIQMHGIHYNQNILWINSENEEIITESIQRLATDKLRISTKNANGKEKDIRIIIEEVYHHFKKRESLFIFDNADNNVKFYDFLPVRLENFKPYVLITSRQQEWIRNIDALKLNVFSTDDGLNFVKKYLKILDVEYQAEDVKRLCDTLQYLPLAIQQAISYIEDQSVMQEYDITTYIMEYNAKTQELLDSKVFNYIKANNDYAATTFTTWKITIDKIKSVEKYGPLALDIMEIIAFLSPDFIEKRMFLDLVGGDKMLLRLTIRLLVKYSMLNGNKHQNILTVHRLVQEVTRLNLKLKGEEVNVSRKCMQLIDNNMDDKIVNHAIYIGEYLHHHKGLLNEFKHFPKKVINVLISVSRYEEALLFGKNVLFVIIRDIFGPDHPFKLLIKGYMAWILKRLGENSKSLNLYYEILEEENKMFQPDHERIFSTKSNIADVLKNLGRHDEALDIYNNILKKQCTNLGPNHPDTLLTETNIARILNSIGNYKDSLEVLIKVLKKQKINFDPNHTRVLDTKSIIADILRDLCKYDESLAVYKQILESTMKDDPNILFIKRNIAGVLKSLCQYNEALAEFNNVLEMEIQIFGPNHLSTLITKSHIAGLLKHLGRHAESLKLNNEVLQLLEDNLQLDQPCALISKINLVGMLQDFREFHSLSKITEPQYPGTQVTKSEFVNFTIRTIINLFTNFDISNELLYLKKLSEYLDMHNDDLEKYNSNLGPDNYNILVTKGNITQILRSMLTVQITKGNILEILNSLWKYSESLHTDNDLLKNDSTEMNTVCQLSSCSNLNEESVRTDENHSSIKTFKSSNVAYEIIDPDHPIINIKNHIAGVLMSMDRYKDAFTIYDEILHKLINFFGHNHPNVITTRINIAGALQNLGRHKESLDIYNNILEHMNAYKPDHPKILLIKSNIASILSDLGNHNESLLLYNEILEQRVEFLGADHPITLVIKSNISKVFQSMGIYKESLAMFNKILQTQYVKFGPDHPNTIATKNNVSSLIAILHEKS